MQRRPELTPEQKRMRDLEEIVLLQNGEVTMTFNCALAFFGCSRRTLERYHQAGLLNYYKMRIKGRVKLLFIVDDDFHMTGRDILKYRKKKDR